MKPNKFYAILQHNNKTYHLTRLKTTIGSSLTADIRIPDRSVLAIHAEVCLIPQRNDLLKVYQSHSTSSKCKYSALLKVCSQRKIPPIYVNKTLVRNSVVLKHNDMITIGYRKHNFVYLHADQMTMNVNDLQTPNISDACKLSCKFPQKNLLTEFDNLLTKSNHQTIKEPTIFASQTPPNTPHSKLILFPEIKQNITPKFSPSICKYFRRINAKSSHIVNCIEKLYYTNPKSNECNPKVQLTKKKDLEIVNHQKEDTSICEEETKVTELMQIEKSPGLVCSNFEMPMNKYKSDSTKVLRRISDTSSKLIYSSRFSPKFSCTRIYNSDCLTNIRKLFQPTTPQADYNASQVASVRQLFKPKPISPKCNYCHQSMGYIKNLFQQNQPSPGDYGGHIHGLKYLFQQRSPICNYSHQSGGYLNNVFQQNLPSPTNYVDHVYGIKYLFQNHSPLCNYDYRTGGYVKNLFQQNLTLPGESFDFAEELNCLFQSKSPVSAYDVHIDYIKNVSNLPSSSYPDYDTKYLRKWMQQVSTPTANYNRKFISNIRKLFQSSTPPADYNEYADGLSLFDCISGDCSVQQHNCSTKSNENSSHMLHCSSSTSSIDCSSLISFQITFTKSLNTKTPSPKPDVQSSLLSEYNSVQAKLCISKEKSPSPKKVYNLRRRNIPKNLPDPYRDVSLAAKNKSTTEKKKRKQRVVKKKQSAKRSKYKVLVSDQIEVKLVDRSPVKLDSYDDDNSFVILNDFSKHQKERYQMNDKRLAELQMLLEDDIII